jgi:hypothetical protein
MPGPRDLAGGNVVRQPRRPGFNYLATLVIHGDDADPARWTRCTRTATS